MTREIEIASPRGAALALIDAEDFALVEPFAWRLAGGRKRGSYAAASVTIYGVSHTHYMHRLVAWAMDLIPSPVGIHGPRWTHSIDHINGNKLDNRRSNLRLLDRPSQMRNPNDALRATNSSGYRGVSYVRSRERFGKPWMAYVTVAGKTVNLGWYARAEEAAEARGRWEAQAA